MPKSEDRGIAVMRGVAANDTGSAPYARIVESPRNVSPGWSE